EAGCVDGRLIMGSLPYFLDGVNRLPDLKRALFDPVERVERRASLVVVLDKAMVGSGWQIEQRGAVKGLRVDAVSALTELAGEHVTDRFVHVWRHVMGRRQADTITWCFRRVRERRIDDHLKLRERSQIIVGRDVALLHVQHDATGDITVLLGTGVTGIEVWREE